MTKTLYILLLISLSTPVLKGQGIVASSDDLFAKANSIYEKKRYSEAQILYQQLADAGYSSKELFYNLGNTFYKMKKYGYAVYYYEKAKQLDPSDEDINFNLELTRLYLKDQIINPPDFILYDLSKKILYLFSLSTWAIISVISWYVFVGVLLLQKVIHWDRRPYRILVTALGTCLLFCVINFSANMYTQTKARQAVILNSTVDVKSEPDNSGSIVFILHEGTEVQIRSEKDDWCEIRLKDGKVGWIRKDDLGKL